jgi:hypothetical protein
MKTNNLKVKTDDGPSKGPSALSKKLARKKLKAALPSLRQIIGAEADIAYEEIADHAAAHLDLIGAKAIEAEAENINCNPETLAGTWLKHRIINLEKLSAKTRQKRKPAAQPAQGAFEYTNSNKEDFES